MDGLRFHTPNIPFLKYKIKRVLLDDAIGFEDVQDFIFDAGGYFCLGVFQGLVQADGKFRIVGESGQESPKEKKSNQFVFWVL